MDAASPMLQAVLTEVIWVVGAGVLGLVVQIAVVVLLSSRRRVPPVLGVTGVGLLALGMLGAMIGGLTNPDLYRGTLAAGLMPLVTAFAAFPMAGLLLLCLALFAFREGPRSWALPGVVALGVGATIVCTIIEGSLGMNVRFGLVRGALYAGLGLLTALAVSSAHPEGRETRVVAPLVFALTVGVIQTAERGMAAALALGSATLVIEEGREEALQRMVDYVAPALPWTWATTLAAMAVGLVSLGWTWRKEGPRAAEAVAALCLLLPLITLVWGIPDLARLLDAVAAGPPFVGPE